MRQIESFFWGIVAALGALVLEFICFSGISAFFNSSSSTLSYSQVFLVPWFIVFAAFIEESFKYLIIFKRVTTFSLEKTFLINSFLVGLGFFSTELVVISLSGPLPALHFLIEIAILHIGTAGLIGYFIFTKNSKKISTFFFAIMVAVFFHSTYNLLTLERNYFQNYAIFALLGLLILINATNFLRIRSKLAQ
jgi:hypothetical protein